MKLSQGLPRLLPSIWVFTLFGAGAACQALAMRRTEMGVVYLFVLGVEAIAAYGLSVAVVGEKATIGRILAVALIVGVLRYSIVPNASCC